VLQRFENLHSALIMASCISKKQRQGRNRFYHVNHREAANVPIYLLERPLEVATLAWMVPHLLERDRSL
jgi:hypothetical protein